MYAFRPVKNCNPLMSAFQLADASLTPCAVWLRVNTDRPHLEQLYRAWSGKESLSPDCQPRGLK